MQVFTEDQIRKVINESDAREAAELAFRALGDGAATVPSPLGLAIHDRAGELHVKCAYLHGSRFFVLKAATGFYHNSRHGLPSGSGLMILFDALTGFPLVLLQDNGYLTELRTAAAGALATRLLAVKNFERLAIIGAGTQARYQLRAFQQTFRWTHTTVWNRSHESALKLCEDMRKEISCEFSAASTAEEAVRDADVVLTVTPSHEPLIMGEWLTPHCTVIAVGSDEEDKRELDDSVFERAGRVIVDSLAQCAQLGELHHALTSEVTKYEDCTELGEIVAGRKMGRTGRELIVCDLTGVGAQDAAIAEMAYRRIVGV